jgi:transposase-like protein
MMKDDAICPRCNAGFRRMELSTRRGIRGEYRCPICDQLLETFDGSTEIAYRLTIVPVKARA